MACKSFVFEAVTGKPFVFGAVVKGGGGRLFGLNIWKQNSYAMVFVCSLTHCVLGMGDESGERKARLEARDQGLRT